MYNTCIATYCIGCEIDRPEWATGATRDCKLCSDTHEPETDSIIIIDHCCECGVPATYRRVSGPKHEDRVRGGGHW